MAASKDDIFLLLRQLIDKVDLLTSQVNEEGEGRRRWHILPIDDDDSPLPNTRGGIINGPNIIQT